MKSDRVYRFVVVVGVLGVWALVLQNAGVIPAIRPHHVVGEVAVVSPVEVEGRVDVDSISDTVDVNLAAVTGRDLVESRQGMYIGVLGAENQVIPVHWGEVSIR